jgi:hypothetical protein
MDINELKQTAGKISQDYLLHGIDMTDAITVIAKEKKLNDEQIRRLAEIANQNTYLEKFQDSKNRGNIVFDTAKSENIIVAMEEDKMNEDDYKLAPVDFRKTASVVSNAVKAVVPVMVKSAYLAEVKMQKIASARTGLDKLGSSVKTMLFDEKRNVQTAINKIASICFDSCHEGDSFADAARLAIRHTVDNGGDAQSMLGVMDKIASYLKGRGVKLSLELTKVAEMKIDPEFKLFKAVDEYNFTLQKIAALEDMNTNVQYTAEKVKNFAKEAA